MKKPQLVSLVEAKLGEGTTKKSAAAALDAVIAAITEGVRTEKVQIFGFGTFEIRDHAARAGRNPYTGEPLQIPASRSLTFKPSPHQRHI